MRQSSYWDKFRRERLSRRKMLKGGLLAGAGLLTASALGCETSTSKPSSAATPASTAASTTPVSAASPAPATAKPRGTFTSNAGAPKGAVFDPHRAQHAIGTWMQWGDDLAMADLNGLTDWGLATSWTVAPDGLSWTFKLRKGVLFHDETEFTAEDVKFSFERQMKFATSPAQPILAGFYDHCEIVDPYTVKVVLKQPNMALLVHLQTIARIVPKKYTEKVGDDYFWEHPVGTGPWKVTKWEPGTRMEYEAFEKHYARVPKFQKFISLEIPDRATILAMFQAGELDVAHDLKITEIDQAKAIPGTQILVKPVGGYSNQGSYVFTDDGPGKVWKDERVRKAFMYSFNREKLAKEWGKGMSPPAAAMAYPYTFGFNPNLKPWPYDLAKAKQLIAEAGYPNGLDIVISSHTGVKEQLEAAAIVLNEAGLFRVNKLDFTDGGAWLQMLQYKQIKIKDQPCIVGGMVGSMYSYAGDVGFLADTYWGRKAMYSYPHPDDKLEEMILAHGSITDVEKRKKFLQDMLQYIYDTQMFPMFLTTPYVAAMGPKVKPEWNTLGTRNVWWWNLEPK